MASINVSSMDVSWVEYGTAPSRKSIMERSQNEANWKLQRTIRKLPTAFIELTLYARLFHRFTVILLFFIFTKWGSRTSRSHRN